jgi:hypothetical protein
MKTTKNISLLLALVSILFFASESRAQVSATARVTLTVVPAPGMNFKPATKPAVTSPVVVSNRSADNSGMTFMSSGNVMVQLNSKGAAKSRFSFGEGQTRTFTARELHNVSSVEIVYLGS